MAAFARPLLIAVAVLTFASTLAGCGASDRRFGPLQRTASPVLRLAAGPSAHIAVIVMENEEYGDVIGSRATPFINRLAARFSLAAEHFSIGHPSLPNYLALTGGSTSHITSDCTDCSVSADNLGSQLTAARIPWRAYMEDLPAPCFRGSDAGGYAKKHDPFVYYPRLTRQPAACHNVVGLGALSADEQRRHLPRFAWITPNLCHDMHDCSTATGDRFLASLVPPLLAALGPRGLLVLTWDEGSSDEGCCRLASGGHIALIAAGGQARSGVVLRRATDHYSTLQAIEDLLGLPRLRGAACGCTPSLAPLLRTVRTR